jgi:hypothetical protein
VGATNLMWWYLGKPKNFLSASAFSLYKVVANMKKKKKKKKKGTID